MELPLETPFDALWQCAANYRRMVIDGWFADPQKPNDLLIEVKVPDVFRNPKKLSDLSKMAVHITWNIKPLTKIVVKTLRQV